LKAAREKAAEGCAMVKAGVDPIAEWRRPLTFPILPVRALSARKQPSAKSDRRARKRHSRGSLR
jgi:hypothetical protein